MTYIYVKKDLTFIQDPASQSLLKAFLKAVYSDEYITQCEEQFGFVRISGSLRDMALESIDALITDPSAPEWTFETNTTKRTGQGDYVISQKRQSYSEIEQEKLVEMIGKLSDQIAALEEQNADMSAKIVSSVPQGSVAVSSDSVKATESSSNAFSMIDEEMDEDDQVMAALVMSAVSIALWVTAILFVIVKHASGAGSVSKASAAEKKPEDLMENGGKVVN
jgi:hypothetical protein